MHIYKICIFYLYILEKTSKTMSHLYKSFEFFESKVNQLINQDNNY